MESEQKGYYDTNFDDEIKGDLEEGGRADDYDFDEIEFSKNTYIRVHFTVKNKTLTVTHLEIL